MSAKRKRTSGFVPKKRKWLTLEQKLDVIKLHEEGASFAKIGRQKGMDESSVRKLIKKKHEYKSLSSATTSYSSKTITRKRSFRMVNMERLLSIWIAELNKKNIPLSQMEIQVKALSLYNHLKETENKEGETNEIFTASRGWFLRFKKRAGIRHARIEELNEIHENSDEYHEEQIFDVDKTRIKIEKQADEEQENNFTNVESLEIPTKELTTEKISKVLDMVEALSNHVMEVDPNFERSITICQTINNAVRCYKDLYEEKKPEQRYTQTPILPFLETTMDVRKLLLLSSSTVHGYEYLQYAAEDIIDFLKRHAVSKILFIPYALHDRDAYHTKISNVFVKWGFQVDSAHKFADPAKAVAEAQAFFVGGGNTFLLLRTLYENNLVEGIRRRVLQDGVPYMGTSAGTNVATDNISTTNDMPIVYPPSFDALKLVPFNINAHYMDTDPSSTHKGETREERILQYLEVSEAGKKVVGMREGVHLHVEGGVATLKGLKSSRLFIKDEEPTEIPSGTDVSYLFQDN